MAEPLVMVAPLAVTMATIPGHGFLKPKVLVGVREVSMCVWERVSEAAADVELLGTDCFFASSPLLRPASEGER